MYGAFLLACYDADSEEYQTICKIGTGFSDEALQSHYEALKPLEMSTPRGDVKVGGAKPDVWFEPKVVWEVLTADLSLSPVYTAAQGLVSAAVVIDLAIVLTCAARWRREASRCAFRASSAYETTSLPMMLQGPSR